MKFTIFFFHYDNTSLIYCFANLAPLKIAPDVTEAPLTTLILSISSWPAIISGGKCVAKSVGTPNWSYDSPLSLIVTAVILPPSIVYVEVTLPANPFV